MLSGATRLAAVIGHPVAHSLSPDIHNAAFAATGLDWAYLAFDVAPGDTRAALDAVRALGLGGLSVTMPHKEAVARLVDRCSPDAEALAAVNCVVPGADGELVGENTDGPGLLDALSADHGFTPEGRRCLVVGAGGAARAVVRALAGAGAREVLVVNRTPERAAAALALAGPAGRAAPVEAAADVDLVVNATPVGMDTPGTPLPGVRFSAGQLVVDLVYHPAETPLLAGAAADGATAANGLGMLVHQAARAFTRWTGVAAPVAAMAAAAARGLEARSSAAH
ncbi:MAG: shikimate dehydrogenase [Acidimicrobiales bacterium]|nr:shikimate dehydrogenase [Acidimicrobiales bacterium]MCB9371296.1 shikimate dehydrogenase [Microthrixaceae bacterium]